MNFNELYYYLERTKKPRKAKVKKAKEYNTGKLSEDEILMYRQMVSDENYLNKAINNMADGLTKEVCL